MSYAPFSIPVVVLFPYATVVASRVRREDFIMNRVLAVLLGVMPLVGLSWSASHGQSGGDGPKATARNHDFQNSIPMLLVKCLGNSFGCAAAAGARAAPTNAAITAGQNSRFMERAP